MSNTQSDTPRTDVVDWWGPSHDMFTAFRETAALCREFERENERLRAAGDKLIDAIQSVQDWNETYVGECIEEFETLAATANHK